jgi:hypothetical protein
LQYDNIDSSIINKVCSLYLYENRDKKLKNEDVFFLLRFALTGNPVGAATGEIGEVIGYKEIIKRIENSIKFFI